jgi:imidazolonepropionase
MSLTLFRDISQLLTLSPAAQKKGRQVQEADLGRVSKACLLVQNGKVIYAGGQSRLPKSLLKKKPKEMSLNGAQVVPGFIECHTHFVFAGSRAAEFELRNQGVSYQEIAARGGGILSTMKSTRSASAAKLLQSSQARADEYAAQGVTTLEGKSGYALNLKDELKCLEVMKKIKGPRVVSTFLGAHAKPPEFETYDAYLDFLSVSVLPRVKKKNLASRVDIFIEKGFFPADAGKKYLKTAKDLGFDVVVHADQLSLSGGSEVALQLSALSADHVIQIDDSLVQKFAKSETTAVLLPAADLYMKCAYPPARKLIEAGARVALATDYNPGSCPSQDLALVGLLARLEMKMTLHEVIAAYTVGASHALNMQNEIGSLCVGKSADFVALNCEWTELFYSIGKKPAALVYRAGQRLD